MGVMAKMRRSTGVVLWVLIFSFGVLWMLQDTQVFSALGAGPRSLGSVNGEPITNDEYQAQVSNFTNQYSRQTGNSASAEQRAYYEQQAWDALVTSKLLTQKMDDLGITVTDQEIVEMITGENPDPFIRQQFSREDGTIDRVALNNAIEAQENSQVWISIEQQLRQKRRQQKMSNYVQSAMRISNYEVQQQYIRNNTTADFSYVRFPYADVQDGETEVTDSDMRSYYDENLNKFERNESYEFQYVAFDKTPTKQDTTRTIEEIENLRTDFAETSDDSLFLARYQSTTPYNDEFVAKEDLRELFEPVLELEDGEVTQVLRDGGELFALKKLEETADDIRFVVLSYSIQADPIATVDKRAEEADDFTFFANQDGFKGEAGRRNLDVQSASATKGNDFVAGLGQSRQILNVLESADEGSVSDPIELSGQFVVLKVNTITPKGPRPFEEVKSQIETTVRNNMRKEKTTQNVASWVENNQSIEALANAAGKKVQSATSVPMSAQTIPGAGREPEVIGTIFSLEEGEMSVPVKGAGAVYVLQVSQHNKANSDAMDNATAQQIRQELQQQKSSAFTEVWLEQLREKAEIEDYRSQVLRNG
jgi:peptidyl-prolyl cis-trans isomerase D